MDLRWVLASAYTQVTRYWAKICAQNAKEEEEGSTKKAETEDSVAGGGGGGGFEFELPLHYPKYKKEDYEKMEEWMLDLILKQYGFMSFLDDQGKGGSNLEEKRAFAIGAFLWPNQR